MEILSFILGFPTFMLLVFCFATTITLLPDYLKMEKLTRDLSDFELDYELDGRYIFKVKNDPSFHGDSVTYDSEGRFKNSIGYWRGFDYTVIGVNPWMEKFNPYLYYLRKKIEKRILALLVRSYIEETK